MSIFAYVIFSCLTLVIGQTWNPFIEQTIVDIVNNLMSCRRMPGLSLAIVQKDSVLMQRGFGLADVTGAVPATEDTRFCIGSCSKAFASTVIGSLLEDNVAQYPDGWSTNIKSIFGSDFNFGDEHRNNLTTLRDILSHRTGFAQYGGAVLVGLAPGTARQDVCRRFHHLETMYDFRTDYLYNNLMYMLASCVAEEMGGETYENIMKDKIFTVLGMDNTVFSSEVDLSQLPTTYVLNLTSDEVKELHPELLNISPFDASGGICSTARDMAKWLQFLLNDTKDGILPTEIWQETIKSHTPQTGPDVSKPTFPITDNVPNYGLAWSLGTYRGYKKFEHSGSLSGFQTLLTVYKDVDLAVFSSSNGLMHAGDAHSTLHYQISDVVLGLQTWLDENTTCTYPAPWVPSAALTNEEIADQHNLEECLFQQHNNDNRAWYDPFIGSYGHPFFGNLTVFHNNATDQLRFDLGRYGVGFLVGEPSLGFFEVHFDGSLSYFHHAADTYGIYPPIQFGDLQGIPQTYQELYALAFDPFVPPTFVRDLQWDDAPAIL